MASPSTSRIRRLGDRPTETQQQLITFQLGRMGFLLPIEAVHKAIAFDWIAHPVSQISFENQLLPVLDVDQQIFERGLDPIDVNPARSSPDSGSALHSSSAPASPTPASQPQQQVALIIQSEEKEEFVVLPIDSAPALCRVAPSSLVPLPRTYPVNCVQLMTDQSAEQSLRFLLSPELLMAQGRLRLSSAAA